MAPLAARCAAAGAAGLAEPTAAVQCAAAAEGRPVASMVVARPVVAAGAAVRSAGAVGRPVEGAAVARLVAAQAAVRSAGAVGRPVERAAVARPVAAQAAVALAAAALRVGPQASARVEEPAWVAAFAQVLPGAGRRRLAPAALAL